MMMRKPSLAPSLRASSPARASILPSARCCAMPAAQRPCFGGSPGRVVSSAVLLGARVSPRREQFRDVGFLRVAALTAFVDRRDPLQRLAHAGFHFFPP